MSTKHKLSELLLLVVMSGSFLGCSATPDLVAQGHVRAEVVDGKRLDLLTPSLREEDGSILVSGVVRVGMSSVQFSERSHVHVELLDADRNVVQTGTARWSPRLKGTRPRSPSPRAASYSSRLPGPLPINPTVRISLAYDSHDGEKE